MYICQNTEISEINHKFIKTGQTYLPCYHNFGVIERATKKAYHLLVPMQWCDAIKKCNHKKSFKIVPMDINIFHLLDKVTHIAKIRKINTTKEKFEWFKVQ